KVHLIMQEAVKHPAQRKSSNGDFIRLEKRANLQHNCKYAHSALGRTLFSMKSLLPGTTD
ncbi:MAG: hypothetical protein NTV38_13715, partial [Chloroflexi bacterium]|nr:hypothetical protein [Chloroflexota bacterium]